MGLSREAARRRRELVQRLMAEREASGESWRSIARRVGMNHATLAGWVWRLEREDRRAAKRSSFVELVQPVTEVAPSDLKLELRGERRVRIPAGFDEATRVRLVRTLESC